jgi:hypothetical protein
LARRNIFFMLTPCSCSSLLLAEYQIKLLDACFNSFVLLLNLLLLSLIYKATIPRDIIKPSQSEPPARLRPACLSLKSFQPGNHSNLVFSLARRQTRVVSRGPVPPPSSVNHWALGSDCDSTLVPHPWLSQLVSFWSFSPSSFWGGEGQRLSHACGPG